MRQPRGAAVGQPSGGPPVVTAGRPPHVRPPSEEHPTTSVTDSTRLELPAGRSMVALLGRGDELLRAVEAAFPAADVHVRGTTVTLSGSPADTALAARLLEEMGSVVDAGGELTPESVHRSAAMLRAGSQVRPVDVLGASILSSRGRTIRPKTLHQLEYVDAIDRHTVVVAVGPAGTGKTYLAMATAVRALQAKQVTRIVLTRPAVEAGERLGFLPGTLAEKIDPYLRPLHDALHDMVDPASIPGLLSSGVVEVAPLAYMRGRTLNDAFIILDEAQNTTPEQMKMFLTRLGFGSSVVVTGDVTQVDLPGGGARSGLREALDVVGGLDDVAVVHLDSSDVVRHRLVGQIVDAWAQHDERREREREAARAGSGASGPTPSGR